MKKEEYEFKDIFIIEAVKGLFEKEFKRLFKKGFRLDGEIRLMEYCGQIIQICIMIKEERKDG